MYAKVLCIVYTWYIQIKEREKGKKLLKLFILEFHAINHRWFHMLFLSNISDIATSIIKDVLK